MTFRDLPPEPAVPAPQRGEGALTLRYEDVTQDGRMRLEPISHAVGAAIWRRTLSEHPLAPRLAAEGILPILSRIRIESGASPIDVRTVARCTGTFEIVRTIDDRGRVRLRMDTFSEVAAPRGRTHGPAPEGAGEVIPIGRMLAEHVFTRPFATDPEQRQVSDLAGGWPDDVPIRDVPFVPATAAIALPRGAQPIDDAFALDPCPIVLGVGHTDANQHVNSLVYPRLVEEAALRRFHQIGLGSVLFARFVELSYRKPCFAGDRMRIALRAFRLGEELGVVAAFITAGEAIAMGAAPSERAHCFVRMHFVP